MTNLIQFFETITGLTVTSDPLFTALAIIFGFIIVYDLIHILFSTVFGFIYKF